MNNKGYFLALYYCIKIFAHLSMHAKDRNVFVQTCNKHIENGFKLSTYIQYHNITLTNKKE